MMEIILGVFGVAGLIIGLGMARIAASADRLAAHHLAELEARSEHISKRHRSPELPETCHTSEATV
jgi:hypothetical protein